MITSRLNDGAARHVWKKMLHQKQKREWPFKNQFHFFSNKKSFDFLAHVFWSTHAKSKQFFSVLLFSATFATMSSSQQALVLPGEAKLVDAVRALTISTLHALSTNTVDKSSDKSVIANVEALLEFVTANNVDLDKVLSPIYDVDKPKLICRSEYRRSEYRRSEEWLWSDTSL